MDIRPQIEQENAVKRVTIDLEDGILAHLRAKRIQFLEKHAVD